MAEQVGLDWPGYFRTLPAGDAREFATWLYAQGLQLGEFMDVVDRAYATWPRPWRAGQDAFIALAGRQTATSYAFRKRYFARLVALLEEAMATGALPGEVAPQELDLPVRMQTQPRSVDELLAALERVSHACG
jgi:hypothetical protein